MGKVSTFRCACGDTVEYDNPSPGGYNVGRVVDATGWRCLFLPDGGIAWLCPVCAKLAGVLARQLLGVTGTGRVQLDHVGDLD